jgi:hypothetical protein
VLLKPMLTLTIIATIIFALMSEMRLPAGILMLAIFTHHAVTAVFAEPLTRYINQVLPVMVVLAAMGCVAAYRGCRRITVASDNEAMPRVR